MESRTPFSSHVAHVHYSFRIISIHVEDGRVDNASNIRTVWRGTRVSGISGETDLIVGDNMDGSSCRVIRQVRQMESFVDDALAGKGCVAVQQN